MRENQHGIVLRDCEITLEPTVTLKKRPIIFILWFVFRALAFTGNPVNRPAKIVIWAPERSIPLWREGPYSPPLVNEILAQFESEISADGVWSFIANRRRYWAA